MLSSPGEPASRRRLGAIAAILGGAAALSLAILAFGTEFPRGLGVPLLVLAALALGWQGLLRRGPARLVALVLAALLLGLALGLLLSGGRLAELIGVLLAVSLSVGGARAAFSPWRSLPRRAPPTHPVLFMNPRSGGGKATRFALAEEAPKRGIDAVELKPGDDLEQLVREAVGRGADGLAMAGGDGSQALVAAIAAEHDLPYACIPSGTRNHFALDLGVDRDDVVGALDAFVDGGERLVDLAEVNGRVFVNNVSLGVYAEAVSREEYRESKLRTVLETIPDTLGPEGEALELRWTDAEGGERRSTALVLVSNNAYRLGAAIGSGTRPRLDEAVLGVVEVRPPAGSVGGRAWSEQRMAELEVDADGPVPVGVDGEALTLEPPLRFRSRPGALKVRISHAHPGASPSAEAPHGALSALLALGRMAATGRWEASRSAD